MKDRIKELRKAMNLTQQNAADRLGVKRNTVAQWETGINNISEQTIKAICREFNVDETWLRTGRGNMFVETPETALDALAKDFNLTELEQRIISKYLNLSESERSIIQRWIQSIFDETTDVALRTPEPLPSYPEEPRIASAEPPELQPGPKPRPYGEMTRAELHAALDREIDLERGTEGSPVSSMEASKIS